MSTGIPNELRDLIDTMLFFLLSGERTFLRHQVCWLVVSPNVLSISSCKLSNLVDIQTIPPFLHHQRLSSEKTVIWKQWTLFLSSLSALYFHKIQFSWVKMFQESWMSTQILKNITHHHLHLCQVVCEKSFSSLYFPLCANVFVNTLTLAAEGCDFQNLLFVFVLKNWSFSFSLRKQGHRQHLRLPLYAFYWSAWESVSLLLRDQKVITATILQEVMSGLLYHPSFPSPGEILLFDF